MKKREFLKKTLASFGTIVALPVMACDTKVYDFYQSAHYVIEYPCLICGFREVTNFINIPHDSRRGFHFN